MFPHTKMKIPKIPINKRITQLPFKSQRNHMGDERGPPRRRLECRQIQGFSGILEKMPKMVFNGFKWF